MTASECTRFNTNLRDLLPDVKTETNIKTKFCMPNIVLKNKTINFTIVTYVAETVKYLDVVLMDSFDATMRS